MLTKCVVYFFLSRLYIFFLNGTPIDGILLEPLNRSMFTDLITINYYSNSISLMQ